VSPLTPDHINPERPWPALAELKLRTEAAGHTLRERLAIYPEYARRPDFLDERLRERVRGLIDADGLVKSGLERWRDW
jgi:FO synthase